MSCATKGLSLAGGRTRSEGRSPSGAGGACRCAFPARCADPAGARAPRAGHRTAGTGPCDRSRSRTSRLRTPCSAAGPVPGLPRPACPEHTGTGISRGAIIGLCGTSPFARVFRDTLRTRMEGFEATTSSSDGVATVLLEGELDIATAPVLDATLADVERNGTGTVVLDLAGVRFIDSTGLRSLLSARQRAADGRTNVASDQHPGRRGARLRRDRRPAHLRHRVARVAGGPRGYSRTRCGA